MGRKKLGESRDYVLDLIADMRAGVEMLRQMEYNKEADKEKERLDKFEAAHYRTLAQDVYPPEAARLYDVSPSAIHMRLSVRGTLENTGEPGAPAVRLRELFRESYADAIRAIHRIPRDRGGEGEDEGSQSVGPDGQRRRAEVVVTRRKISPEEAEEIRRRAG